MNCFSELILFNEIKYVINDYSHEGNQIHALFCSSDIYFLLKTGTPQNS